MARIMPREYFINVETFSELFALENLSDNMDITVTDASGDIRTNGGTVVYTYVASKSGIDAFIPRAKENEELVVVEQESLTIVNGSVTLQYIPSNGIIFDAVVRWIDSVDGLVHAEDVIYTLDDKQVLVDSDYNGKTLSCKYLRNDSGKIVSTVVQDGHLHTHDNKSFLDTVYSLKTINGIDFRGVGDIIIGGATAGNGLALDANGAFEINEDIVATKDYIDGLEFIVDYSELTGKPTTVAGYGITDVYTKAEVGILTEFTNALL